MTGRPMIHGTKGTETMTEVRKDGVQAINVARGAMMITVIAVLLLGVAVTPAMASQSINGFEVTTSTTQAGGHPDIGMHFNSLPPVNRSQRGTSL